MRLFESHCHLDDRSYDKDREAVINRARKTGVSKIMIVGITDQRSKKAVSIAESQDGLYASVGIHPHDAKSCSETSLKKIRSLASSSKVKAWGEIGLDFNRLYSPRDQQEKWFIRQLEIADEYNLPVIFHERDSKGRFLEVLNTHGGKERRGVVHCFSGNTNELMKYLEMGFHIGVTGILTLNDRGKRLREQVLSIPFDRILIETDAPYLTPAPERNRFRRNEPAFVKSVLMKLADVRKEDPEILAETIWENTCRLFNIDETD
jgi:TatD DNase family protein